MRSTNLVIFLALLNVAAGIFAVAAPVNVTVSTGASGEIDATGEALADREISRPASGELIGSFLGLADLIERLRNIIFYGPEMLRALGAPAILVDGFEGVLLFVMLFDVAEAVTGRGLS